MAALRACTVSYQDNDGITHCVDVTAETLFEAAVLGMNALRVQRWHDNPNLKIPGSRAPAGDGPRGLEQRPFSVARPQREEPERASTQSQNEGTREGVTVTSSLLQPSACVALRRSAHGLLGRFDDVCDESWLRMVQACRRHHEIAFVRGAVLRSAIAAAIRAASAWYPTNAASRSELSRAMILAV